MTDTAFSPAAQAIEEALKDAASRSVAERGVGHAFIHEDMIGGLGPNPPLDPEKLAEYVPSANRAAIDELRSHGYDIGVSKGSHDRFIQIRGARFARQAA